MRDAFVQQTEAIPITILPDTNLTVCQMQNGSSLEKSPGERRSNSGKSSHCGSHISSPRQPTVVRLYAVCAACQWAQLESLISQPRTSWACWIHSLTFVVHRNISVTAPLKLLLKSDHLRQIHHLDSPMHSPHCRRWEMFKVQMGSFQSPSQTQEISSKRKAELQYFWRLQLEDSFLHGTLEEYASRGRLAWAGDQNLRKIWFKLQAGFQLPAVLARQ